MMLQRNLMQTFQPSNNISLLFLEANEEENLTPYAKKVTKTIFFIIQALSNWPMEANPYTDQSLPLTPSNVRICRKLGHTAVKCWYTMDPSNNCNTNALVAPNSDANPDWVLDIGATSYITYDQS